ncbi:MAG: hypothetical protein OXE50_11620 [Chloroflexi bacterium]|nr:hypothetical protein [Chloroflexota bacterium]
MTTEPLQPQQPAQEAIPQYFVDFVQENARQHAELAASLSRLEVNHTSSLAEVKSGLHESVGQAREEVRERTDGLRESVAEVKGAVNVIRNFTIATFGAMFTLMLIVLSAALRGDLP